MNPLLTNRLFNRLNTRHYLNTALTALLLVFALSSCAPLSRHSELASHTLPLPQHWQTQGKLALHSIEATTGKKQNKTLRFHWQQYNKDYQIKLSGSFGVGTTIIKKEANTVSMLRGKSVVATAADAETLFAYYTGVQLPVSQLQYWITGQQSGQHFAHQTPRDFHHKGWAVKYPALTQNEGYALPAKMIASNGVYTVTAIISSWQLASGPADTVADTAGATTPGGH